MKRRWRTKIGPYGVVFGLILVNVLAFGLQVMSPDAWTRPWMVVPVRMVASVHELLGGVVTGKEIKCFATLITHAFLHGDLFHLGGNLLYLWISGALITQLLGGRWTLALYLLSAIGGGVVHVALQPTDPWPMLGASGAISGLMGAYVGLALRWALPEPHIWPMAEPVRPAVLGVLAVVFVAIDYQSIFAGESVGVAFGAHVGGFTTGLLVACLAGRPRWW